MEALRIAAIQLEYAPNLTTALGNYWLPEEAAASSEPLGKFPAELSVRKLAEWPTTSSLQSSLSAKNQRLLDAQLGLRVKQILDYCADLSCDLVVFPEACMPASAARILLGYSTTFAIFAGLGRVRQADIPLLDPLGISREHLHKNCAVFLDGGTQTVVSKLRVADGERADPGEGFMPIQFKRKGRVFGIAAAICKDYLADDDRLLDSQFEIDIVLVSALSRNTEEFLGRTPRQCRVFANHASYGGTAIQVAHLESLGLSDLNGVEPLPGGTEGVVVIDYTALPNKLTALNASYSRVVARSAVVYDDRTGQQPDQPSQTQIIEGLRNLRAEHLDEPGITSFLEGSSRFLGQVRSPILAKSVQLLRQNQMTGTLTQADLESLSQHLLMTDVKTHTELRYLQVENLLDVIVASLALDLSGPGMGTYRDGLLGVKQDLLPWVRARFRASNDRNAGGAGATLAGTMLGGMDSQEAQVFYSAGLGQYEGLSAVESLPLQLAVLRTLAAEGDTSITLSYRLTTTRMLTPELVPFFESSGKVTQANPHKVESLREGLGQLMGVSHTAAYSLSAPLPPLEGLDWAVEIRPTDSDWVPAITHDWAPLIDLLRAQEHPVELTMLCHAEPGPDGSVVDAHDSIPDPVSSLAVELFMDDAEKKAGTYFASLASDPSFKAEPGNLRLRFLLRAPTELSATLVRSIGLLLVGSLGFETVTPFTAPPILGLRASQALRVFHPPYGKTQGRGIPSRAPKEIPLPAIQLPSSGVSIGSATLSSARHDRDAEVRLDTESRLRHIYVVGRTGSGKTNFLKTLARQDIAAGSGLAVIDPHGDLVDYLLRHVDKRSDEVLLLDFGDPAALPVLNPIDLDVSPDNPASGRLAIDDFIRLLERQSYYQFYGPRFEDIVRLTLESLTESDLTEVPTVLDVSRVLRSKEQRTRLVRSLRNTDLVDRWKNFEAQRVAELAELIHWTLAKFSDMDTDGVLGAVLGGGKSSVAITQVVKDGGILLVRIPEWEIGPAASAFIGGLIQEHLRRAAFERFSESSSLPPPFYMYVDEFQKFATSGFEQLLAEARKFGLGLVLAHQNLRQLEEFSRFTGGFSKQLLEAVLGNVANMIVLGVSARDAEELAKEFVIKPGALGSLPANIAIARVDMKRGDSRTFSLRIPYAESDPGVRDIRQRVRQRMIDEAYWRPREDVEAFMSENRLAVEGHPDTPTRPSDSDTTARKQRRPMAQPKAPAARTVAPSGSPGSFYQDWKKLREQHMENMIDQVSGPGAVIRKSVIPPSDTGPAEDVGPSDDTRPSDDMGQAEAADAE